MAEREQVRPLAPASERPSSDDEEAALHLKGNPKRTCIKWYVCFAVFLILVAVVVVSLIFTVFRVKDPIIRLNGVQIHELNFVSGTTSTIPRPGSNVTLTADVSVKNPNYASFRYSNTTTSLFYHGLVIGEASGPPGQAKARRTMRMNITVHIITDRLISHPLLIGDMGSGFLPISSFTRVGGKVKLINLIKRHVVVKMNCTMTVNTTSQSIQYQKCKKKVKL